MKSIINGGLPPDAEVFLVHNKIALPTPYTLKREINSFCYQHQDDIYCKLYQLLPRSLITTIDNLLEIEKDESVSWFQKFKEYPGTATISLLKDYLKRNKVLFEINIPAVITKCFQSKS